MRELIRAFPVTMETPIDWGDMDAFQHVNNKVYFKFFENIRIAYFEQVGFIEEMTTSGIGPILASTQCQFKIPLTYPDRVAVGARIDQMAADRFRMRYVVVSSVHEKVAAEGEGQIVCYDYANRRKAPIPDTVRRHIIDLEKQTNPAVGAPPDIQ